MNVKHKIGNYSIEKKIKERAGCLISNGKGSYFSQGINSRYSGFFCNLQGEMYRILDSVSIGRDENGITNNLWSIDVSFDSNKQNFFMPKGYDVLVCSLKKKHIIKLNLDVRKSYDLRKWGKSYKIYGEGDYIIIEFTKTTDKREDDSEGNAEYKLYIAICGESVKYKLTEKWINKQYDFDRNRGSQPFDWYIYDGLHILSKNIIISAAEDKKTAIINAKYVKKNIEKLQNKAKKTAEKSFAKIGKNKEISFAYNLASESMKNLCIGLAAKRSSYKENPGIFAGLPWFFQFWTRDEAISLKSLMLMKEYKFCNDVLMRELKTIGENGRIPNRFPGTDIETADGTGWMFMRCADLRDIIDNEKKTMLKRRYLSSFFKGYVKGQLEKSLKLLYQNFTSADLNKFALNKPQETWMDTVHDGDNRAGIRIEIQALRLAMYKLAYELSGKEIFNELEKGLRAKVKEHFWNRSCLADGLDDWTVRPNIFIAAYIYPELLTKKEWKRCFRTALPKLWLRWGGLATIDKSNPLFCPEYTGETPQSYHRGDSWFWLNNLAAIVMARTDKNFFKKQINKIMEASAEDILYKGFIGHHSEVSSASMQKAEGCLCQAWSNAMFIELVHEVYGEYF